MRIIDRMLQCFLRKNYLGMCLRIFVSVLLAGNSILYPQQKQARYSDLSPDIFNKFTKPVGVVIFPFLYNGTDNDKADAYYKQLTESGKNSKVIVQYYKNLDKLREQWGFKKWDFKNKKLLAKLDEELDCKLVVYANLDDPEGTSFSLIVINTSNLVEELNLKYVSSFESTPLKDAVKLLTENKKTSYVEVITEGTLVITTRPAGEFKIFIDDKLAGQTPYENNAMKKGRYKLTIVDPKSEYQDYNEYFQFDPNEKSVTTNEIKLSFKAKKEEAVAKKQEVKNEGKVELKNTVPKYQYSTPSNSYNRKTKVLLVGVYSIPQGVFKSQDEKDAGFAEPGYGGSLEWQIPMSSLFDWIISLTANRHKFNTEKFPGVDKANYFTGWLMTGFGLNIPFNYNYSSGYYMGILGGGLFSKFPDLRVEYEFGYTKYAYEITSDLTPALGYGFYTGIYFGAFDFGLRYYTGKPEYIFKFGENSEESKQSLPTNALLLTFGFRF